VISAAWQGNFLWLAGNQIGLAGKEQGNHGRSISLSCAGLRKAGSIGDDLVAEMATHNGACCMLRATKRARTETAMEVLTVIVAALAFVGGEAAKTVVAEGV
jgi:hypothetical protein